MTTSTELVSQHLARKPDFPASEQASSESAKRPVYILGAGFSKALSDSMPLLGELSALVQKNYSGWPHVPPEIRTLIAKNLEDALTFLAQSNPWHREAESLRNRALYLDLTHVIAGILSETEVRGLAAYATQVPDHIERLILSWHHERATVVTLNYDTLVERIAGEVVVDKKTSGISIESIYPATLTNAARRNQMIAGATRIPSFLLLKLHGSTNWYYSGREFARGETIYFVEPAGPRNWWSQKEQEREPVLLSAVADKYPMIVPPVFEKASLLSHESMQSLWVSAARKLEDATEVVFIGYSLPPSDRSMRHFLRTKISKSAHVEIVDLNPDAINAYANALDRPLGEIQQRFHGADCLRRYVEARTGAGPACDRIVTSTP